jgi:hypothetical protein
MSPKPKRRRTTGAIRVFIELRDANYPDSAYNLTYAPPTEQIQGVYFQAALQQQFEVSFVRVKGRCHQSDEQVAMACAPVDDAVEEQLRD